MEMFYTNERNTQILIVLMKAHNIKKVVASPGTTNIAFVSSIQNDSFFEIYSSVDERSAAYIACGLAAESGEPVVLSCTGATASRNYMSGLTEAYYRKLPVLAITSAHHVGQIGQNIPQILDRSVPLNDIVKLSVQIPIISTREDEWACNQLINKALLELTHRGGGPVHINLFTNCSRDNSVRELPQVRIIKRVCYNDSFPELSGSKVAVFVGAHKPWTEELTKIVDDFCEAYNGVVLYDHTSNYTGNYGVLLSSVCRQRMYTAPCCCFDLMIHIGDISGDYSTNALQPTCVWRVNPDGEVRDTFKKLTQVFEMEEVSFFAEYVKEAGGVKKNMSFYKEWKSEDENITSKMPDIPFSNLWMAKNTVAKLPEKCVLHLGILNSLRAWNFFEIHKSVTCYSNTGGFGIDGLVSTLVGASLSNPQKLYFGVVGDLAFFYDMNVLGNHHFGSNVRLLVVNNGRGTEFRNYSHIASKFGEEADRYIAAAGHFGAQSRSLIKHYAEDLGFEYLTADSKQSFLENIDKFTSPEIEEKSIIFEVFTNSADESQALEILDSIESSAKGELKQFAKDLLGEKGRQAIKKALRKN